MTNQNKVGDSSRVYLARTLTPEYQELPNPVYLPELNVCSSDAVLLAVRSILSARFGGDGFDTIHWNPLQRIISEASRVVIKPNWVHEKGQSKNYDLCLTTHLSLVDAVLSYVCRARPNSVVVGDAPLQGCNWSKLEVSAGISEIRRKYSSAGVEIRDFRMVKRADGFIVSELMPTDRDMSGYVLFDLGPLSLLENLPSKERFRVTMYDPDVLCQAHGPGKHQYLIAKELISADVIFNLPKLKTHLKTGITGPIKNMVGANGHKSFLPHHRKGSPVVGGDAYAVPSALKRLAEDLLDRGNRASSKTFGLWTRRVAKLLSTAASLTGNDSNVEGSWHGNDTAWRMALDLQRIVHYGRLDGTLSDTPQRKVLNFVDAVVAGIGDGPLCPEPYPIGKIIYSDNVVAAEYVCAQLLGLDPNRLPIVSNAFRLPTHDLVDFLPGDVSVTVLPDSGTWDSLRAQIPPCPRPPQGWIGHCESSNPHLGSSAGYPAPEGVVG